MKSLAIRRWYDEEKSRAGLIWQDRTTRCDRRYDEASECTVEVNGIPRHVKDLRRRQPCSDEEPRDEEGEDRDDEGTIRRSKRLEEQRIKTSAVILENQEGV